MRVAVGSVIYASAIPFLDDFLKSIEAQDDQKFELILLNDDIIESDVEELKKNHPFLYNAYLFSSDSQMEPYQLRIELIKKAKDIGVDLLILADCDDVMSENRVAEYKNVVQAEMSFYYNDICDINKKPVMPELPDVTDDISQIMECNYLGLSNSALWLKDITEDFLESLYEGKTPVFDWYLFSRLLLIGYTGKKVCGCNTYYRIHADNIAGRCIASLTNLMKEIEVKTTHYKLLMRMDKRYEKLYQDYKKINVQSQLTKCCNELSYWWGLIKINDEGVRE